MSSYKHKVSCNGSVADAIIVMITGVSLQPVPPLRRIEKLENIQQLYRQQEEDMARAKDYDQKFQETFNPHIKVLKSRKNPEETRGEAQDAKAIEKKKTVRWADGF